MHIIVRKFAVLSEKFDGILKNKNLGFWANE